MLAPVTGGCAPARTMPTPSGITRPPTCPLFAGLAEHWLTCDGYFAAIMAPSYPNRIYQHAAQTDRLDQSLAISSLPTIWDRLAAHGLQGRYYYTDVPTLALWGTKYRAISHHLPRFLADCRDGDAAARRLCGPEVPRGGAGDLVG